VPERGALVWKSVLNSDDCRPCEMRIENIDGSDSLGESLPPRESEPLFRRSAGSTILMKKSKSSNYQHLLSDHVNCQYPYAHAQQDFSPKNVGETAGCLFDLDFSKRRRWRILHRASERMKFRSGGRNLTRLLQPVFSPFCQGVDRR
jgi:hypothetical protein